MIFFLYGEDTYRSHQKLNLIKNKFLAKDKSGLNLVELDGAKILYKDLKKEFTSAPFLYDKKLVIVNNLLTKNKQIKLFDELNDLIKSKNIPKFIFIIFREEGKPDARKGLFKTLKKEAQTEEFACLTGNQINRWIINEIKARGGEIEIPAVNRLAAFVGSDLWQLANEIDKLLAYNNKITVDNVNLLVNAKVDDNIFKAMDAISVKNKKLAMQLIRQQLKDIGNDVGYLFNMIVRQFRILIQVKSFCQSRSFPLGGGDIQKIASALKLHPFVAQKTLMQAKNFKLEQLKNIYTKLMEIEYKLKTSQADPAVLLDLLVAEI
jgi:DNA polymerase-3 subunit delta